jgi:hypothetical protein
MMAWNPPPKQSYEYEVNKLVSEYKQAAVNLKTLLLNANLNTLTARERQRLLAEIVKILRALDASAEDWIEEHIPKAYQDGQAAALVSIGEAATLAQAAEIISKNKLNTDFVAAMIADTMDDLLMMTHNTEVQVKRAVRKIVGEQIRSNVTQNEGRKSMERDVKKALRKELERASNFAIRDRANRVWSIEAYSDMVVRTKIQQARLEGTTNEALSREAYYAVISTHNSKHLSCRRWEGKIVKLTADAPGDYPTLAEVRATGGIFHPNCQHQIYPTRDVSLLPEQIRANN